MDGLTFHVTWDYPSDDHGVALGQGSLRDQLLTCAVWDVTDSAAWAELVHSEITDVLIFWGAEADRTWYPQDLELRLATGVRIFFRAGGDSIEVIFGEELARKYRVGPYS